MLNTALSATGLNPNAALAFGDNAGNTSDYLAIGKFHLIPQGIDIPMPVIVFAMLGIPMFTKKSFSVIIAKPKAGKTTAAAWIIASAINAGLKVLWIDNEQGLYYGSRTQHWILQIAGLQQSKNLHFYDLKIHAPNIRTEISRALIEDGDYDIVVFDGTRDFVFDINSPEEATNIATYEMELADTQDCHIVNIIHTNKGNDNARGHLGTELINKAETVVKISQNDAKQIVIEPEFTRGKPFEPFALVRDEITGIPSLIEGWSKDESTGSTKAFQPYDVDEATHKALVRDTFSVSPSMIRSELSIAAKSNLSNFLKQAISRDKTSEWINHWMQYGHIKLSGTPKTKSAKYSVNFQSNPTELNAPFIYKGGGV
ncbi:AAA family ATPase [Arcticibacter eurypsychrophilus]|uniref:AAA family ATPase n=1 Tax=Arcticibacter eurypsychrophilus TaxID=1434752 RepID=UPI00084D7923|nr:AAA family ATPase [Arcticibacter eurypsychrophilus]